MIKLHLRVAKSKVNKQDNETRYSSITYYFGKEYHEVIAIRKISNTGMCYEARLKSSGKWEPFYKSDNKHIDLPILKLGQEPILV